MVLSRLEGEEVFYKKFSCDKFYLHVCIGNFAFHDSIQAFEQVHSS